MAVALEIRQIWGEVVLDARQFPDGRPVTVGAGAGDRWRFLGVDMGFVPAPLGAALAWLLPGWSEVERTWRADFVAPLDDGDHVLAAVEDGARVLRLDPQWPVSAAHGERTLDAEALLAEGLARRDEDGTLVVPVVPGLAVTVSVAGQTFEVKLAPRPAAVPIRPELDLPFLGASAVGLALFALVVALIGGLPGRGDRITIVGDPDAPRTVVLDPAWQAPAPPRSGGAASGAPKGPEGATRPAPARPRSDRDVALQAGVLGTGALDRLLGSELPGALAAAIGGLTGSAGGEIGGHGLGQRGAGWGGGGEADALEGFGPRLRGDGAPGGGDGDFRKREGGLGHVVGDPLVVGALDRSLVDEVVKRHLAEIRYCYQRELVRRPELEGKVTVKFTIAADGSVAASSVASSTLGSEVVEACVQGRFLRMRFPPPKGGGIVIVRYPFVFGRG